MTGPGSVWAVSSVMRPVGPQSPGVYWVRRGLAVLIVLVVLLGAWWLVGGRGGAGNPSAAATPGPSLTPAPPSSPAPLPSVSKKPSKSPTAVSTAAPTTSPTADPTASIVDCKNSAITVTVSTDAASYPVGSTPRLRMRIANTSGSACRRDVGAPANELIVKSGGNPFWSSDDCNPGGTPDVAVLAAGQTYSVTLVWLGRASAPKCPADQAAAVAGPYTVVGRNGGVTSAPVRFSLT